MSFHASRAARAPLALLLLLATACLTGRPRRDFVVSSERSEYSPVVQLAVRMRLADSLRVMVDSGRILAPGTPSVRAPRAIMHGLVLEAIVAEPSPDGMREPGVPGAWRAVAASAPVPIADSLVLGVPLRLPALVFTMRPLGPRTARRSWLIFRIRGDAMSTPVQLADGTTLPSAVMTDAIRVHACAERSVSGHLDRRRARRLRDDYLGTC